MDTENYSIDENTTVGCGCPLCAEQKANALPNENDFSYSAGDPVADPPLYAPGGAADPNDFADYLTHGYWSDVGSNNRSWSQDTVTFSLSNEYSAAQKEGIREAFDLWSDVADINFNEVSGGANILIVEGDDSRAYARTFTSGSTITSSTISIDTNVGGWSNLGDHGDYAFMTILHEIGHALGLGHTGNYNGSATYANDAQWVNDTHQTSVMSYFSDTNVGSDHRDSANQYQYSATPMLIDILAIQNIYGVNYNTRNGDTTYGFNSNAGHDQYDFSVSEVPIAIWDGGGTDTIDASGYLTNQTIYLTAGYFSSVGHMTNNLVIAYGAEIENAIGGSGFDSIYGNEFHNTILGGAGADSLFGSLGDDILDGESGTDTVTYSYSVNDFSYNFISNTQVMMNNIMDSFTDTVKDVEQFIFTDGVFTFAELDALINTVETAAIRLSWSGGSFDYNSTSRGTEIFTAADIGFNGSSDEQLSIFRNDKKIFVDILDENGPDSIRLTGSDEDDIIYLGGEHTSMTSEVYGGAGRDIINVSIVGNGSDTIYAEDGNDVIKLQSAGNTAYGGNGNDQIWVSDGEDMIYGDSGRDLIYGNVGNDTIDGGAGSDTINYRYATQAINVDLGVGTVTGTDFTDTLISVENIKGSNYNDTIIAATNATVFGMNGDDVLYASNGYEILNGGRGDDLLYAMETNGLLSGSLGADTFIFENVGAFNSTVRDFDISENDALDISDILSGVYDSVTDAIEDFVQITDDGRHSYLAVDTDGGGDSFQRIAVLGNVTGLTDEEGLESSGHLIA